MFVIEDEFHAEWIGKFSSFEHAIAELRRIALLPRDGAPNQPPCMNWETCGREYSVVEYDDSHSPWQEVRRVSVLRVSASGVEWSSGFESAD